MHDSNKSLNFLEPQFPQLGTKKHNRAIQNWSSDEQQTDFGL